MGEEEGGAAWGSVGCVVDPGASFAFEVRHFTFDTGRISRDDRIIVNIDWKLYLGRSWGLLSMRGLITCRKRKEVNRPRSKNCLDMLVQTNTRFSCSSIAVLCYSSSDPFMAQMVILCIRLVQTLNVKTVHHTCCGPCSISIPSVLAIRIVPSQNNAPICLPSGEVEYALTPAPRSDLIICCCFADFERQIMVSPVPRRTGTIKILSSRRYRIDGGSIDLSSEIVFSDSPTQSRKS